jgi:hypothetical protein
MKLPAASTLYLSFVAVSVITGLTLARLEGSNDRPFVLEVILIGGFFSLIPLLIIASVAAWREEGANPLPSRKYWSLGGLKFPLILLMVGILGLLVDHWASTGAGIPEWIATGYVGTAIPALYAFILWLGIIGARRLGKRKRPAERDPSSE